MGRRLRFLGAANAKIANYLQQRYPYGKSVTYSFVGDVKSDLRVKNCNDFIFGMLHLRDAS